MNNKINNNEHPYVDLGLPSGTLWATCNVGANKPTDYGFYFQWGDTIGYNDDQVGKDEGQKRFLYDDYRWYSGGKVTKYITYGTTLELEDDAANAHMGGDWHMPSPDQIQELLDNATITWTTQDGTRGITFTSKKCTSKSIFIPAAGFAFDGSVLSSGTEAGVWTSMLDTDDVYGGQYLYFYSGSIYLCSNFRYYGFSVRGVIG